MQRVTKEQRLQAVDAATPILGGKQSPLPPFPVAPARGLDLAALPAFPGPAGELTHWMDLFSRTEAKPVAADSGLHIAEPAAVRMSHPSDADVESDAEAEGGAAAAIAAPSGAGYESRYSLASFIATWTVADAALRERLFLSLFPPGDARATPLALAAAAAPEDGDGYSRLVADLLEHEDETVGSDFHRFANHALGACWSVWNAWDAADFAPEWLLAVLADAYWPNRAEKWSAAAVGAWVAAYLAPALGDAAPALAERPLDAIDAVEFTPMTFMRMLIDMACTF